MGLDRNLGFLSGSPLKTTPVVVVDTVVVVVVVVVIVLVVVVVVVVIFLRFWNLIRTCDFPVDFLLNSPKGA